MSRPNSSESVDRWTTVGLFAAALSLYGSTLPTSPVGGDALLFTTIFADGGYAHPPGYPLYSLYLRVLGSLSPFAPSVSASAATALLAAGAVALFYRASRAWMLAPHVAAATSALFAISADVWLMHSQPEVFALLHLLAAGILLGSAPEAPLRGGPRVALLGVLAGLGLSHHHAIVLIFPIGFWGVWQGLDESDHLGRSLLVGPAALGAGLLPYLLLLADTPDGFVYPWTEVASWDRLTDVFLRERYGTLELSKGTHRPFLHVAFLFVAVFEDTYFLAGILALVGFGSRLLESESPDREFPPALGLAALGLTVLTTGPAFASLFNLDPVGPRALTVRRLHLLFELHLTFAAGFGLQRLALLLDRPRRLWALLPALLVLGLGVSRPSVLEHRGPEVGVYLRDTFARLPDRAVVVGAEDINGFGHDLYRRAYGRRRDVTYVHVASVETSPIYADLVEQSLPIELPLSDGELDRRALLDRLVASDRPVFATEYFSPDELDRWPTRPRGTLIRLFPASRGPVSAASAFEQNVDFMAKSALDTEATPPAASWRHAARLYYAEIWDRLARRLEEAGDSERAAEAARRRDAIVPNYTERPH